MQVYESRITRPAGAVVLIASGTYRDDDAAIHAAIGLCRGAEIVEVWRGDDCVYSEVLRHPFFPQNSHLKRRDLIAPGATPTDYARGFADGRS
jgi:hypothetical protein